ncbi:Phosphatidate cytidylyltransferase [Symbiodinium microadriaticum]|uniref:Phosphatidate cytidylyltransferase n=1 Tax=Symbiodinium microadriaticum TaxID=2951 RepID=A0A1Q9EKE0_SYMMI|nr:Phosphatidate cytidylyltransferase [Symbiodinium microadriaticum]
MPGQEIWLHPILSFEPSQAMLTELHKRIGVFVGLVTCLLLPMWASELYCYVVLCCFVAGGTLEYWTAVYSNVSSREDWAVYVILFMAWFLPTAAALQIYNGVVGHTRLVECLIIQLVVGDSAQLIVGRSIGRHHVCVKLSPKKTLEGYIGGFVLTFLYGAMVHGWSPVNICVVYVFGCAGDLYFSAIKRRLGIKDYSRVLSSHGGLLDRIDSFMFAANALVWKAAFLSPD